MKLILKVFGVVVILAVLAGILIPTVIHCGPSAGSSITRVEMNQAGIALQIYHQEYGQLPSETDNAMLVQILEGDTISGPKNTSSSSCNGRREAPVSRATGSIQRAPARSKKAAGSWWGAGRGRA
jgi:hypothetical protein